MGLKQIIRQQKILASGAVDAELELPGEPLIYSIKYSVGQRTHSTQFFRNMKWRSLLKCCFLSYYRTSTPVVVIVRFYVSPPSYVKVKASDLKKETVPAVFSFEICEYLLSFFEMLHRVLINSYRQIARVETEKFYSSNPRTVFQFMKWDHYVNLQNKDTVHAKTESICTRCGELLLQPERQGNAQDSRVCEESTEGPKRSIDARAPAGHSSLRDASAVKPKQGKTKKVQQHAAHKKT